MTNEEIDDRLVDSIEAVWSLNRYLPLPLCRVVPTFLSNLITILGEIAKRLPEPEQGEG